jgi:hypothetical protein
MPARVLLAGGIIPLILQRALADSKSQNLVTPCSLGMANA